MQLIERIQIFDRLFDELQSSNSRLDKEACVADFKKDYPELQEDWRTVLETLDGRHPIGWTFTKTDRLKTSRLYFDTVTQAIKYLVNNKLILGLSADACHLAELEIGIELGAFLEPIVNRTLKLGIGKSLLEKTKLTPMLAKKYEGGKLQQQVVITEKLDGNRCLALYDGTKWTFTSRTGKPMNVNIDMTYMPQQYVYDGEIMGDLQTDFSNERARAILEGKEVSKMSVEDAQLLFSATSGLISRKGAKTGLVYNIFDIVSDLSYVQRRKILNQIIVTSSDVRIIPVLYTGNDNDTISKILDVIVDLGGEGIMLNLLNRNYDHKRSDALLKYKKTYTIDMFVKNVFEGKGKYEGAIGGLVCSVDTDDGRKICCEVGSGLTDAQRISWANNPSLIIGKVVEVAHKGMSQDRYAIGTTNYSLRFPSLKRIRSDKNETSEY